MIIHNFKILCIMAINYSLVKLASKFGDKAGVSKFYARAQMNESISLKKFAKLIAMQTTVSYADVTAVLISLQENMVIELQRGNQIDFGELGKFRLQLTSEGAATAAEFKSDINIKGVNIQEYEWTLRETRTFEIIEDVHQSRSDLGILYLNDFNRQVISKLLKKNDLCFHPLFRAEPHVFVSSAHPLARRRQVLLEDLEDYPCLSFEQGTYNSFYFSEEILSTIVHRKEIHVSDRATLFNLLIGLNGYTICSGVLSEDLNGSNIISIPLKTKEYMLVGWIDREQSRPSRSALLYIEELKRVITEYGYEVIRTDD